MTTNPEDLTLFSAATGKAVGPLKSSTKGADPKQACGAAKPSVGFLPMQVVFEVGAAMSEGARKYGPYNWRRSNPVIASTYFNATMRHLAAWWEGQDIDPDSNLHHVVKAISSLVVLRDAMLQGQCDDDRSTPAKEGWLEEIQRRQNKS